GGLEGDAGDGAPDRQPRPQGPAHHGGAGLVTGGLRRGPGCAGSVIASELSASSTPLACGSLRARFARLRPAARVPSGVCGGWLSGPTGKGRDRAGPPRRRAAAREPGMLAPQPRAAEAAPRPTRARQVVVGFTLAAMGVAYLDRVCISTAAPAIQADLAL